MTQMKQQEKSPEKELNEMESTKIPDVEFKTMVIRMFKDLTRRMGDLRENLNKQIINIKKNIETIKRTHHK